MPGRIATALVLIPLVVALVWWAPPAVVAGALAIVLLLALHEFFDLGAPGGAQRGAPPRARTGGLSAFRGWTGACAVLLIFAQWSGGQWEIPPLRYGAEIIRHRIYWTVPLDAVLVLFALGCMAIALGSRVGLADLLPGAGLSAAGLLLIVLPASFLVRLDQIAVVGSRWVLFLLTLVWAGDIAAFFVGQTMGRTPLSPLLSPKKTWEGAAGNVAASLVVGYVFAQWLRVTVPQMLILAALASVAGQCGDLMESAWKRGAQVKDSSALLPGHGGMLDRIDSLIFATPVVWYYVDWLLRNRG
jgi:phosphatidate cytidylyltransferase